MRLKNIYDKESRLFTYLRFALFMLFVRVKFSCKKIKKFKIVLMASSALLLNSSDY